MMLCNHTSRYHVAAAAIRGGALHNQKVAAVAHEKGSYVMHQAAKEREYIFANGKGE
jgi:xylulose-5-phosphate/fructose-6-phosphate phosphoketolase